MMSIKADKTIKETPNMCLHLGRTQRDKNEGAKSCSSLLWINEARATEKTYICVSRGTGKPKDKDEVNRREVCECEGWVWDLDAIGAPSRLRLIRKAAVLAADLHISGVWRQTPLMGKSAARRLLF
jgi:hypothetical protein